jgi:hypothetical protein
VSTNLIFSGQMAGHPLSSVFSLFSTMTIRGSRSRKQQASQYGTPVPANPCMQLERYQPSEKSDPGVGIFFDFRPDKGMTRVDLGIEVRKSPIADQLPLNNSRKQ